MNIKWKNTHLIAGIHAIHDTYTAFLPVLLPKIIEKLMIAKWQAGFLTVFLQGPSVIQPVIGYFSDKKNLIWIFIIAPSITGIGMSLAGAAHSYWMLASLLVISGISSAFFHALGSVTIGYQEKKGLGKSMGFWMLGGETGRTLGPVVFVSFISYFSMENTYWMMLGGIAASIILYFRFRKSDTHKDRNTKSQNLHLVWIKMKKMLLPLSVLIAGRSFLLAAMTIFLPVMIKHKGEAYIWGGVSLFLVEASGIAGAIIGGSISDVVGRRKAIFISMMSSAFFMTLLLILFFYQELMNPILFRSSYLIMLSAIGFSALSVGPSFLALVQENFNENRALANGVYLGMNFVIRSIFVTLFGYISDIAGMDAAFGISIIVVVFTAFFIFKMPENNEKRN